MRNQKIYQLIGVFTLLFIFLLSIVFNNIRDQILDKIDENRHLIAKNLEHQINVWIDEQINIIEKTKIIFESKKIYDNEDEISKFSKDFLYLKTNFDIIQFFIDEKFTMLNGKKILDFKNNLTDENLKRIENAKKLEWFIKTKTSNHTTINYIKKHVVLKVPTVNFCTPIKDKDKFKGVMCGVINIDNLFKKLKDINPPKYFYYFIVDEFNTILAKQNDQKLMAEISKTCKNLEANATTFQLGDDIIRLSPIKGFDWKIGVGVDRLQFFKHSLKPIIKNTAILSMCIFVFFVVLNLIYGFLIRKNNKKTEEMELLLARKSRLNEIGSLITGINHQLKQPLNSLNLAISNSELLLQKNSIDIEMLLKNMSICKNQINLMNKTINIFRSFYSPNEDISEFCLNETIKSIIYTTNSQFFKYNITVKFEEKSKIFANSIENFIQQILLVLLQNSKDAILEKKDIVDKNIYINIEKFDKDVIISISDFGIGIDARQAKNIFNASKTSSKKLGFGFGLYFSKILSTKKLDGDLVLENHKNPTKFSLKIPLDIRK